jgi:hypothetical protein
VNAGCNVSIWLTVLVKSAASPCASPIEAKVKEIAPSGVLVGVVTGVLVGRIGLLVGTLTVGWTVEAGAVVGRGRVTNRSVWKITKYAEKRITHTKRITPNNTVYFFIPSLFAIFMGKT